MFTSKIPVKGETLRTVHAFRIRSGIVLEVFHFLGGKTYQVRNIKSSRKVFTGNKVFYLVKTVYSVRSFDLFNFLYVK